MQPHGWSTHPVLSSSDFSFLHGLRILMYTLYLARAHPGVVKGAATLCWMQLRETRKWAINRHRDGKDKSFPDYVMGNGSLNTKQTEKSVLSTTAFWLFAVNCYVPTSRPWAYAFLIYWYGYGLWGQLEVCETCASALVLFWTFVTWVSGYLSVCENTELKTSSDRSTAVRNSGTEDSNRHENNMRWVNGKKGNIAVTTQRATTARVHILSLFHNRFHY